MTIHRLYEEISVVEQKLADYKRNGNVDLTLLKELEGELEHLNEEYCNQIVLDRE